MTNKEKIRKIINSVMQIYMPSGYSVMASYSDLENIAMQTSQWKDEQLNSIKDEIQSNLCASSGFNDEYSRGYQDCGMKIMEMIDKILEL